MIKDFDLLLARTILNEARDHFLLAARMQPSTGSRERLVDAAIAHMRDAAEALGYALVEKSDGK